MEKSRFNKLAIAGVSALSLLAPLSALAAYDDGLVIPSGTTTNFTSALSTYFYNIVMTTVFQAQMIQILVVFAAISLVISLVFAVWSRFRLRH